MSDAMNDIRCPVCGKPADYLERYFDRFGIYSGKACSARNLHDAVAHQASRSIEHHAIGDVVQAIRLAQVVAGPWGPVADGHDPYCDLTAAGLDEIMAEAGDGVFHWPSPPNFEAATLERSRVDREYLRLTVGKRQFLIQEDVDGGYGDDGTGHRTSYHLRICGDVCGGS